MSDSNGSERYQDMVSKVVGWGLAICFLLVVAALTLWVVAAILHGLPDPR